MMAAEHLDGPFGQLVWNDAFLCGNRLIDEQHRGLFHESNELLAAIQARRPSDEIAMIVNRLLDGNVQHFQDEEAILAEREFPGLLSHAAGHAKLVATGRDLAHEFDAGALSVERLFRRLTRDVIALHILGADREYAPLT